MGNIFSISATCDPVTNRCLDCAAGQAGVIWKLEENVDGLKTAVAELKDIRNDVTRRVKIAEDEQQMKRLDQVQGWLLRGETLINAADALAVKSSDEIKKLCLGGCCSKSPRSSLKFGKQIDQMLRDVVDHKSKGVFDMVADKVPTPFMTQRPTVHTVGLESTFGKVWSSLENGGVGILGLYGMGGVGKTTLLNQINNKFCETPNGFDVVIWVVVSKYLSIGKVQDAIAKQIGIVTGEAWDDKTSEEKALNIFSVLKGKKFVLLLDDIWERVDLCEVGIPPPTRKNGSKLVFTTRSVKVCGQMEAEKKIEVQCLVDEKAWELFQEKVGEQTLGSDPSIRKIAREVAKECGGLPLALITIGRAMASKNSLEDWQYAVEVLRRPSTSVFEDLSEQVFSLLKFSYESLPNDMYRACLLYCSLFPEDFEIEKDELIDYWIGEGILDGDGNPSLARNQGHHIITYLVHACLLEEVYELEIKMHDVVRDMSLWIACKCEEEKWKFFVQARCSLTKAPEVGRERSIHRMSLIENEIEDLTEAPDWPDLHTLLLKKNKLTVINNDFFLFMSGLKVLDLSRNFWLTELPLGISKLVSLEYLNLYNTVIRELPIELKALEKLKCLILGYKSRSHPLIPTELIPSFSKLQVLKMIRCYYTLGPTAEHNNEYFTEELKCLHYLNLLAITITSAFQLDSFLSNDRLCSCTEHVFLDLFDNSKCLNILSVAKVKGLKYLDLYDCQSLEDVKIEWEGEGGMTKAQSHIQAFVIAREDCFHSLRRVHIGRCSELRDVTWVIFAPNLKGLYVYRCNKMEEIINKSKLSQAAGPELVETSSIFPKLEELYLRYLPELKGIYWDALPFSCLKRIRVFGCPKLKRLLLDSNSERANKIRVIGEREWWNQLQWEDDSILNAFDPPV